MHDILKIRLLKEVLLKAIPQNVDYDPHNGQYQVELLAIKPIVYNSTEYHDFVISGNLDTHTLTALLTAENKVLLSIPNLPYIAPEGDRTPIYKIIRASVLSACEVLPHSRKDNS